MLPRKQAIKIYFILPPHLTSASALPGETGNPEIASNTSQMTIFFFQQDSAHVHCVCNTIQLSEMCDFRVSAFSQVVQKNKLFEVVKRLLIAYFIGNISAKKYQNPFMCVKVIANQRWDVF